MRAKGNYPKKIIKSSKAKRVEKIEETRRPSKTGKKVAETQSLTSSSPQGNG
jgi:hypothetical protein